MSLDKIDTSYWLTKDKTWMEERKAQWPAIEKILLLNRKKTEVNVAKQYFLKGKMPKWEKYRDFNDIFRPLDLRIFLWLHPSEDFDVLSTQYSLYIESDSVHPSDIISGYGAFVDNEFLGLPTSRKSLEDYPYPFMGKKNITIFKVLFSDLDFAEKVMLRAAKGDKKLEAVIADVISFLGYGHFLFMRRWLMQEVDSLLSQSCLYQYDEVLEWCLSTLTENRNQEFRDGLNTAEFVVAYQKALYCLYRFDAEKEGDTCRTRFVHKIRKILDERDFIPEFKQMWEDVKAGKVEVKDPWTR